MIFNLTIETLGAYAGSLMVIILLVAYFVKPVVVETGAAIFTGSTSYFTTDQLP